MLLCVNLELFSLVKSFIAYSIIGMDLQRGCIQFVFENVIHCVIKQIRSFKFGNCISNGVKFIPKFLKQ